MAYNWQSMNDAFTEFQDWCEEHSGEYSEKGSGGPERKATCRIDDNDDVPIETPWDEITLIHDEREAQGGGLPYMLEEDRGIAGRRVVNDGELLRFTERGGWDHRQIGGQEPVRENDIGIWRES